MLFILQKGEIKKLGGEIKKKMNTKKAP